MSDLQFGLDVSPSTNGDPVAAARRAEELGFDFVSTNDHLNAAGPRYETWTMLAWMAAATTHVRVASRVLGVPYRNPAVVAKMAESFDRLSGGRLILGLGGGAVDGEFRAFGIDAPSPRDKVDGLEEAIRIARGLWSDERFTLQGRLHRTDAAEVEPKPAHHIPIWVGTYGPRALALTGRLADGWIPSYEMAPPERIPAMRERIADAARAADRDPSRITCVYNMVVRVGGPAEDGVVSGSPDELVGKLQEHLALGFTAFNFIVTQRGDAERLAHEVVPALRASAP